MTTLTVIEVICRVAFFIVLVDRLYLFSLSLRQKKLRKKEVGGSKYPKVAIQLPMYNEWAVYERVIDCACEIDWPRTHLIIQVLDDSSDEEIKPKIDAKVRAKAAQGHLIEVVRRPDRKGYKAGSLQRAMGLLKDIPYVAIFDADFEPEPDFLRRTVPLLEANDSLAFIQARWTYTNASASSLTKLQKVSLDFHHRAEQMGRSNAQSFLNFNGSAGVWRVSTIFDSGGWSGETLVEDMDLSLRAFLRGQSGLYLDDLECRNELPQTDRTYRTQQRRWLAGPMHLATTQFAAIWRSPFISKRDKIAASWFFLRYSTFFLSAAYLLAILPVLIAYHVSVIYSVTLLGLSALVPFFYNWRYWYLAVPFTLGWDYSYFKLRSAIEGLLRMEGAKSWTVTERAGSARNRRQLKLNREEAIIALGAAILGGIGFSTGNWGLVVYGGLIGLTYASLAAGTPSKL